MSHFYLTLPSNNSAVYYPDNTMTNYSTRLLSPIDLTGEWEMALVEISFTKTWYTLSTTQNKFSFNAAGITPVLPSLPTSRPVETRKGPDSEYTTIFTIPAGNYSSVQELCTALNLAVTEQGGIRPFFLIDVVTGMHYPYTLPRNRWPEFNYDPIKRKVAISMYPGGYLKLNKRLTTILGFTRSSVTNTHTLHTIPTTYPGPLISDIKGGLHGMYVYCDVVEHVCVGDTAAPLLRIVDVGDGPGNGETITRTFNTPRYIPMRKTTFDSIEIDIRDDTGQPISFEGGKLVVVVHCRRANSAYLPA